MKPIKTKGKRPKCGKCPTCGAPGIERPNDNSDSVPIKHVNLLDPLDNLVRVIRNMECGDYSPIMDELFDAEHAIRLARGNRLLKGVDWEPAESK